LGDGVSIRNRAEFFRSRAWIGGRWAMGISGRFTLIEEYSDAQNG